MEIPVRAHQIRNSWFKHILIISLMCCILIPSGYAVTSENKVIYDLPLFDNFGPAFATWSGESEKPLGDALLKGTVTLDKSQYNPGDTAKITLDLTFSGTIISGKNGALMNDLGYDTWMLKSDGFLGFNVELGQVQGSEYMGIGKGQEIPPLMLRTIRHTYTYEIPESVTPGTYDVYAFIENSEYKTNPVSITITGDFISDTSMHGVSDLTLSQDFDEDTGESIGVTDIFSPTDERICVLVSFDPLTAANNLEYQWYDPSGNLYTSFSYEAQEEDGWSWCYIDIADSEKPLPYGEWTVDFLSNGEVMKSATFTYEPS